jgi:hypothetical protein
MASSFKKLEQLAQLKDHWNYGHALAFNPELIRLAQRLVALLPVQPEIFPTARGSIQLEYENERGEYLEFEVFINKIQVFKVDADGTESGMTVGIDDHKKLREMTSAFHGCDI